MKFEYSYKHFFVKFNGSRCLKNAIFFFLITGMLFSCKTGEKTDWPDKRIEAWLSYYDVGLEDFKIFQEHDIPYRISNEFEINDADIFRHLFVFNADSSLAIDLDSYHLVVKKTDDGILYSPGREVDMEIGLIDIEAGVRRRILFCGTPCLFEEASFHPSGCIIIAGFIEGEDGYVPALWEIDPQKFTVSLSQASKSFHPKEILYIPKVRLKHIHFWFDPDDPPGHLDVPL